METKGLIMALWMAIFILSGTCGVTIPPTTADPVTTTEDPVTTTTEALETTTTAALADLVTITTADLVTTTTAEPVSCAQENKKPTINTVLKRKIKTMEACEEHCEEDDSCIYWWWIKNGKRCNVYQLTFTNGKNMGAGYKHCKSNCSELSSQSSSETKDFSQEITICTNVDGGGNSTCQIDSSTDNDNGNISNNRKTSRDDIKQKIESSGGCPHPSKLPKVNYYGFVGARIYHDKGGPVSSIACNGHGYDYHAGYKNTLNSGAWALGSVYVHSGCQLHVFQNPNYQGKMATFTAKNKYEYEVKDQGFGYHCSGRFCVKSFIVECSMIMPNCVPSDEWTSVAYLDNSDSSFPTTFTYEYQIGTDWSTEITQNFETSLTVKAEIKKKFFGLFAVKASATSTTKYNWKKTSYEAMSDLSTFNIATEIPAGKILKIEQARGVCGDSSVKTEMFKTTDVPTGRSKIFYH